MALCETPDLKVGVSIPSGLIILIFFLIFHQTPKHFLNLAYFIINYNLKYRVIKKDFDKGFSRRIKLQIYSKT